MKKLILFSSLFFLLSASTFQTTTVYVCTGKYATKYHFSKSCRGLTNCKGAINQTTLDNAGKLGYSVCLIESK